MAERGFNMVSPAIWECERFLARTEPARLLHMYFLTSPHQNSSGCHRVREGYLCEDLRWTAERYREARRELVEASLIDFDEATSEVYVERWFRHCGPANPKHALGTSKRVEKIDSERLRAKVGSELRAADEARVKRLSDKAAQDAVVAIANGRPVNDWRGQARTMNNRNSR